MKKTCSKCGIEKDLCDFNKDKTMKDGLYTYCKECKSKNQKEWRLKNKKHTNEYKKKYLLNNPGKRVKYNKKSSEYRKNNADNIRIKNREYLNNRRKTDKLFLLRRNISSLIRNYFKSHNHKKNSNTAKILGCDFVYFKMHIESKFESWMTWDNYGKYNGELNFGWDLDHIIPISSAKTEEDMIKLNHFTNFQPLCSKVNREIKQGNIK